MGVKIKQTWVETYPVGEYEAKIVSVVEKEGTFGMQLQVAFKLTQMDEHASPVHGWASKTFSNKSKLYAWTKAAFGGLDIPRDYTFDSDDLIGKTVILVLVIREREDGTQFNRIDSVRAVPRQAQLPLE